MSTLKKTLWRLVSAWVKETKGKRCWSCGKRAEGYGLHAGHLIPRSVCGVYLYFYPKNLYPQDFHCNINAGGNGAILGWEVNRRAGEDVVKELFEARKRTKKMQWDKKKLQALIDVFKTGENYEKRYDEIML